MNQKSFLSGTRLFRFLSGTRFSDSGEKTKEAQAQRKRFICTDEPFSLRENERDKFRLGVRVFRPVFKQWLKHIV
jgi:hypothetical protein